VNIEKRRSELIDMKNLQKGIGLAKVKPALQVHQKMKG